MTAQETIDKVKRLGVTLVACPDRKFLATGDVAPEILATVKQLVALRRDEIWPLLSPPEFVATRELTDQEKDAIDAACDAAMPWRDYWEGLSSAGDVQERPHASEVDETRAGTIRGGANAHDSPRPID